jgi:transposase-like protein
MAKKYVTEFKENIIARMLPPRSESVPSLSKETGISVNTLYTWRIQYRNSKRVSATSASVAPGNHDSEEKLLAIIETASLSETELGEYCRRKGYYPEQIARWRASIVQGLSAPPNKADREQLQQQSKMIKQLHQELNRKEKALAETAALLVLGKKVAALWEE